MANLSKWASNLSEFDFNSEKQKLLKSLNFLKSLSVTEYTFYKKWEEMHQPGIGTIASNAFIVKMNIWSPTDINDVDLTVKEIETLDPEILFVEDGSKYYNIWTTLRLFCHTMEFNQNPGRFLRFLIIDKNSGKYLGATSVASDVISITDRDNYLGWTTKNRLGDRKLAHSAIGSCIMATQPFGHNFLGGKLIASLTRGEVVRNKWKEKDGITLIGMTTTSLYGSYSMYNNIPGWHKCGSSTGSILIKPDQLCYDVWHQWIKTNNKEKYDKAMTQKEGIAGPVTGAKLRILSMIMSACEIKPKNYNHGYERGVYYSCFYENSKEFLQNKIVEKDLVMKSLYKDEKKNVMDWWKPKAIARYKKLHSENKIKSTVLFYDTMIDMSYEKAKIAFFSDVGVGK